MNLNVLKGLKHGSSWNSSYCSVNSREETGPILNLQVTQDIEMD